MAKSGTVYCTYCECEIRTRGSGTRETVAVHSTIGIVQWLQTNAANRCPGSGARVQRERASDESAGSTKATA